MGIKSETVKVTTTGSAGSATGSATTHAVVGELLGVRLNFHASAPATTDTTIAATTHGFNALAITDSATDGYFAPAVAPVTAANGAITNAHRPIVVADTLTISLAGCNALTDALVATVFWRD